MGVRRPAALVRRYGSQLFAHVRQRLGRVTGGNGALQGGEAGSSLPPQQREREQRELLLPSQVPGAAGCSPSTAAGHLSAAELAQAETRRVQDAAAGRVGRSEVRSRSAEFARCAAEAHVRRASGLEVRAASVKPVTPVTG